MRRIQFSKYQAMSSTIPGESMKNSSIYIRTANSSDAILLSEFGAKTFSDSFAADNRAEDMQAYLAAAFSPEKQAEEVADPASLFLIAEIEGVTAGYARLLEGSYPEVVTGSRPIELVRIYAGKEWIGHGVGAALMEACLQEASQRGCDMIWLGVWERNERALAFYRKWGFQAVGKQTFLLGSDLQTDVVMQRVVVASLL
jgi:diamine N-acetyltransferase